MKNFITENFNKYSCGELIHLKNPHKSSQKFKTTHTHYFINQRSCLNISPTNRQKHLLVLAISMEEVRTIR